MSGDDAVVRRTKDGWRVGDADVPDLTSAMVLADLISAELARPENLADEPTATTATTGTPMSGTSASATATSGATGNAAVPAAPEETAGEATAPDEAAQAALTGGSTGRAAKAKVKGRAKDPASLETSKLRATIGQLEHALTARIRVEQAIGVLAERHRIQPRQAFEQLRTAARNRGRRVIDIASDVVASATNPLLQLPDELSRPRATGRQGRRSRQTPGVLSSE
jgi:ANTAR domain